MSDEPEAPAAEAPPEDGPKAGADPEEQPQEGAEAEPEPNPFDQAGRNPLSGSGGTGGSATATAARRTFAARGSERTVEIGGDGAYFEGNYFVSQFGVGAGPRLVAGDVPTEELLRLDGVYCEARGYGRMKERLRACGLLVLCGERGSGRSATALALLAELTGHRVTRLDSSHTVHELTKENLVGGRGHLLELPSADALREPEPAAGQTRGPGRLSELHLDQFSSLLQAEKAFGVVLVESGDLADRLLRGRYGMNCAPPPSQDVLDRHLRVLLKDAPDGALEEALALAARSDVQEALGLDALRPREAARLAQLLARRQREELGDEELLDECAAFVRAQARAWFAGADRPGTVPEALPALGAAAFRTAVAVFNGSAYSLTAEAGERLAWEMAVTLDPGEPVGRRLFGTRADARPALARAVVEQGELDLGDAKVPVDAIRFQGAGLATAVLREIWHGYHNMRGPLARWLRDLCDDPRPQLWVRASIAAGVLCSWDWAHGSGELVHPMATSDSPVLQMAAATALSEASREPAVQPAVAALVKEWAQSGGTAVTTTAVLTHGYGMAAGSVAASLDALAKLVRTGEPDTLGHASFSVIRLLAGAEPETVLGRLDDWLRDGRREAADLVLLAVIGALKTRTTYLWGLQEVPALEPYGARPLLAALLAVRPGLADPLAGLVRHSLATARSGAATLDALSVLVRQSADDAEQVDLLCAFLPRLSVERRERDRLRHLLARLVKDPDELFDRTTARRMWNAVQEGAER
ncbi:hypothetical protein ACFQVC_00940 [Streptomyces monticola]|uniref:ATPase n=1 Tax=Streptomyces monticola TaxID=2666263 RepID=A0ABW2JBQ2_9ACTN